MRHEKMLDRPALSRGDRFTHRYWLHPANGPGERRPLLCIVTAVRGGWIYYRPDYGVHDDGTPWLGSAAKFGVDQVGDYVLDMVKP